MSHDFPESDWKHFRVAHAQAIQRFCAQTLSESQGILGDSTGTPHECYRALHTLTVSYRATIFTVYCVALRRVAADIIHVQASAKRFAAHGVEHKEWRKKVDATPLDQLTVDAIGQWKLRHLAGHKQSPEAHSRAVNTVNAHLGNARSLFTFKALESAVNRLVLPDPLPFATVKLERKRAATRYVSRMDPAASPRSITPTKRYASPPK